MENVSKGPLLQSSERYSERIFLFGIIIFMMLTFIFFYYGSLLLSNYQPNLVNSKTNQTAIDLTTLPGK